MLKGLVAACYFFVALVLGPACSGSPSTQTTTARLTAASSSSMCLDVLDYGATCNDGLDDRVATQTWLDAQSPLTPGCDLPPCTLSYARNPEPGTQHIPSIRVRGTGKRFWGAGKNATTIEMIGGSGRDWTLVDVTGEGHVVGNFTATGANRGLTESEQTHLIQLTGPASDIDVLDAELHLPQQAGNHGGDCIRMLGSEPLGQEPKFVNGVTIERVFAPECDRSFVGFQRGTYNVWIANVISIIVGDAAFDFEPTGQGEIGWITVRDSQAYTGHGGRFATPAGNNTFAHDILFERVATDGGGFFLYRVARATFRDMTIVMTATAPDHTPFAAIKEGARLRLRPKVMTVATIVASLLPIMWSTRTGAEVMKPLKMAFIASSLRPVSPPRTKYVPKMEESTPIPRTTSGKIIHSRRPVMCQSANPRIKPETMVTS